MQENLRIVRDCWWHNPSGAVYVTDENGTFSSHEHALKNSLNSNDDEYIQFHGAGNTSYYGRLQSTNIDPTHIYTVIRADASVSGDATIWINGDEIGSIEHVETKSTQNKLFALDWEQKERILNGRTQRNYDYFGIDLSTPIDDGNTVKRLYDLEIYYSGDATWNNYETGLYVETATYYPTSISYPSGTSWTGGCSQIEYSATPDTSYMELINPGGTESVWGDAMPSGYLSLEFTPSGINPGTQLTRAQLNLRMALPPSGDYENAADTFEINGYSSYYRNKGHVKDLEYLNIDSNTEAYYIYGAGGIIEEEGFTNYNVELNFLDPSLPSGDIDSVTYRNIDVLSKMEFQIVGMPSGTRLSMADLSLEYIPNNMLGLYIVGDAYRCATSSTVDVGTDNSYFRGDGGWHHRGWRYGVPFEQEIFDNFYSFSDIEFSLARLHSDTDNFAVDTSYVNIFPESVYYPDYNGDKFNTVYGTYVERGPKGYVSPGEEKIIPKAPNICYEYYRSPLKLEGTNDYGEYYRYPSPTRYRHMFFQGDTLQSFDSNNPYNGELSQNIRQIYFKDLALDTDFTLYFMIYRTYFERSYGVIFDRGGLYTIYRTWASGGEGEYIRKGYYEIQVHSQPGYIQAYVRGANGLDYNTRVDIKKNSTEPILIWVNGKYEDGYTTFNLYVHDDIDNYFGQDWKTSSRTFAGYRYQQADDSGTALGTLSNETYLQHLTNNRYLNHVSFCEFGYSSQFLELNPYNSVASQSTGYDNSSDKSKQFLSSRLCNGLYLDTNPSGIQWKVPYGLGEETSWSTDYSIDEWTNNNTQYELFNPVGRGGTNEWIHPSAIYVDIETTHNTDHPSGVTIFADIEFDSGSNENWKVGHIEFNIPSGEQSHYIAGISKYFNMEGPPIKYSDLQDINLRLTTKYVDISDQTDPETGYGRKYYGDLVINSVNVVFDSYCVAATGFNDLDLYTVGGSVANNNDLDLFVEGCLTDNDNLDLYTYGIGHLASGDITLYTFAEKHVFPEPTEYDINTSKMNLFIEGLDPPKGSGSLNLYTWATDTGIGGIFNDMTLYAVSQYDPRYTLPLFIDGGTGDLSSIMNLYLENHPDTSNNSLNLYTVGPSGENNSVDLYIGGLGESEGYYPVNSNMNLFMARDSEGIANRMSLFLAQKNVTNTLNMVITGAMIPSSSIPLYIYGSGAPPYNSIDLYTHGF